MRPPRCEICDADVATESGSDGGGGLVRFQPDDRSRDWRRRAEQEPGFVGHPPDTGWFCSSHIERAREVAQTCTFDAGLAAINAPVHSGEASLNGVDLGSAQLMESDDHHLRWVEWTLPVTDALVFAASLRSLVPTLFEALGIGSAPTLERRTKRRWSPMDGALPPWCPFTDSTFDEGVAADGTQVQVQVVLEHWNEDDVAKATVSLSIGDAVSISAHGSNRGGRVIDNLTLWCPTTPAIVAVVATLAS